MNYTNGGLHNTAYYLKGKGRGKDTELVHMTPKEVKGLQALAMAHGGSLTINPSTGLPEAGFLEDILPIVAAAGLTYLTAGAATPMLMSAGMGATSAGILAGAGSGALISGGMAAVQGKDVGQAALMGGIGGGISGGLGAYGDANVFGVGVAPPPADVALTAATEGVANPNLASNVPITSEAAKGLTSANTTQLNQLAAQQSSVVPTDVPLSQMSASDYAAAGSSRFGAPTTLPDLTSGMGVSPTSTVESANALKTINTPVTYYDKLGSGAMDTAKKVGIQALPGITGAMAGDEMEPLPGDEYSSRLKRISPDFRAYEPPRPNPYYRAQYAAEGGIMQAGGSMDDELGGDYSAMGMDQGNMQKGLFGKGYAPGGVTKLPKGDPGVYRDADPTTRGQDAFTAALTRLNSIQKRANIKGLPALKAAAAPLSDIQEAAKGGVMSGLGGYSDGGRMLKGPGDGMSDSIPGVIGRKQPARLADGEFVVPADVVSHLGNGSTDAGAKRLYAMMDNIRKARTGKKKQAPAVKADRYMPA